MDYILFIYVVFYFYSIDHIIFSNMLEDNTNNINTNNNNFNSYHSSSHKNFNSLSRHTDMIHYSIFDVNKTMFKLSYKKQIMIWKKCYFLTIK